MSLIPRMAAPWWWKLVAPHGKTMSLGLAATVLCSAAASMVPYWAGRAVSALERGEWSSSRLDLAWMMLFTLFAGLGRYWMRQVLIGLSRRVERMQREEIFRFFLTRPFAFHERQSTGDLMAREGDDVSMVRMAVGPGLMSLFATLSMLPATMLLRTAAIAVHRLAISLRLRETPTGQSVVMIVPSLRTK